MNVKLVVCALEEGHYLFVKSADAGYELGVILAIEILEFLFDL